MDLTWLPTLFEKHDSREVQDLIATFMLTFGYDAKKTPMVLLAIMDAFAIRAGVQAGEPRGKSEAKIKRYLAKHPLNPELKLAFEQGIREAIASEETGALTEAFARFAEQDLAKRAPDGKRPDGTRPGYLALLAHDDID